MMMMMNGLLCVFVVVSCQLAVLLHGAPREHLVEKLPGQPWVGFKQYSGYIEVVVDDDDESSKSSTNLFYYFVEAEANSSSLPLALWLNGGPGCSSIGGGAFSELGPFYPNSNGQGLRRNPYSWNKVANLLFLESPAGVGYSYSENRSGDYSYDDWKVAKETLAFMRMWFSRFQEYRSHKLLLTGESYAGHYIPQLAWLMLMNSHEFNLKGILIGNPLLNFAVDTSATYSYLWSHGVISDRTFHGVSRWCDFRFGYMGGGDKDAEENTTKKNTIRKHKTVNKEGCTSFLGSARDEIGGYINIFDVTSDVCPPPAVNQAIRIQKLMGLVEEEEVKDVCVDHEISRYLNQKSVQRVLHANVTSLPYPWQGCSSIVNYSAVDQLADMSPLLVRLIEKRLPMWIFSGDQDSVVPLTGTRSQIAKLAHSTDMKPGGHYRPWFAHGQVGGWCETYGNGILVYATVRGASHMVPYTQPERALVLFASFVLGNHLPDRA